MHEKPLEPQPETEVENPTTSSIPLSPSVAKPLPTHSMITRTRDHTRKPKEFWWVHYNSLSAPSCSLSWMFWYWAYMLHSSIQAPTLVSCNDRGFNALLHNRTWQLVPPKSNFNLLRCKWVFHIKRNANGSIAHYKTHLVTKGFHQQEVVDYKETFSLVIKPTTVHLILSLLVTFQWPTTTWCA